jgi:hypothetical protein
VDALECFVETSYAPKPAREGDFDHRQIGLLDQLFGKKYAACLGDSNGSGAHVSAKQATELTFANPQSFGEFRDVAIIEGPRVDEP